MTKEEQEAANAALALDEMIEKRVWEIIQRNPYFFADMISRSLRSNTNPALAWDIYRVIEPHLPLTTRRQYDQFYSTGTNTNPGSYI